MCNWLRNKRCFHNKVHASNHTNQNEYKAILNKISTRIFRAFVHIALFRVTILFLYKSSLTIKAHMHIFFTYFIKTEIVNNKLTLFICKF